MFQIEWYIDLCPWKGKTSVRWSRNVKKKNRQNRPKTHLDRFTPSQPNRSSSQTYWVSPIVEKERRQSTKWDKEPTSLIKWQSTTEDCRKGENGRILLIFFDGHPKPQTKPHHYHPLMHRITKEFSERIERKDGETMTKIEKRRRTTLTFGRPFPSEGSGLVSLRIRYAFQHKNNGYIHHFNTGVMNVLT